MFIDARSRVDREGLRTHVLEQLHDMKLQADYLVTERAAFWQLARTAAKQSLVLEEQDHSISVINQLVHLPEYITTWIDTAVDSPERFEFFILSKANELRSGDQQKDYFWALQIRHDQLVALIRVVEMLLEKMKLWVSLKPAQLFDDPVFAGLTEFGVEDQVFLEAERVYQERKQLLGTQG